MPKVEEQLKQLGIALPQPPKPVAAYVPSVVTRAGLLWIAGMLPFEGGSLRRRGKVGGTVTQAQAAECARVAALNALAVLRNAAGDLDRVERIVSVRVFVACEPSFTEHSAVANGASDLLVSVFGDTGRHARAAVGVTSLPLDSPVEVEMVAEMKA